jgi:predicted CoA-binding protein
MIDCYAELAPNLKGAILHRDVVGPWQMEQEWGLVGGNIFHGELSVEQLFHMRPAPRVRRLPQPDRRALPGQLGHPRRRRGLRHPRLAGVPGRPGRPQADQAPTVNLVPLLEPRSLAVVGASDRPGSFGDQLVAQLLAGGYRGEVHLVNPRHREVAGLPCHPSLADLPGPVDLAVLAVPNAALEAQLRAAADAGVPAAVIFASCVDDEPPPGGTPPLVERLRAVAAGAGMAVCGGNGMGFFNLGQSLRVCGYPEPPDLAPGPVAVVSHSGSVFSALLHNRRGLRFNLVVSAGNELVTSAAAYLDHALELPSTRVVALFLETVREPAAFRAALAKAAARAVPVVALTVGRGDWSPACRPPTRWTPGAPATTPTRSSPAASGPWSRTRPPPPSRSTWT